MEPDGTAYAAVARQEHASSRDLGSRVAATSCPTAAPGGVQSKDQNMGGTTEDFGLIETLRWSVSTGFVRLLRHLDRLSSSARDLSFRFDRSLAEHELERYAHNWMHTSTNDRRVRLLLQRSGDLMIEDAPAPAADTAVLSIGFASPALDADNPLLRHKTTCRRIYEAAAAEAKAARWAEALLLNTSGGVADGSRHSIFASIDGRLITPSLAAGALAGVLRAELIDHGYAVEADLRPEDLEAATAVFIGNSLRGLRKATLHTPPRPSSQA